MLKGPGLFPGYKTGHKGQEKVYENSEKPLDKLEESRYTVVRVSVRTHFEAWLSLVERCVRDAEAAGSNPVASMYASPSGVGMAHWSSG